jgi:hypothetical protein
MMTTDRELLELAAKATGLNIGFGGSYFNSTTGAFIDFENDEPHIIPASGECPTYWNPLTSGDDVLRLAVELHMTVRCYMGNACVQISVPGQKSVYVEETNHADPTAATRRAIVRAAAEIGDAT